MIQTFTLRISKCSQNIQEPFKEEQSQLSNETTRKFQDIVSYFRQFT